MQMQHHPLFGRRILLDVFRTTDMAFGVRILVLAYSSYSYVPVISTQVPSPKFLPRRMLILVTRAGLVGPQDHRDRIGAVGNIERVAETGTLAEIL